MVTKMAFNPLPWLLTTDGFRPDLAPPLPEMLRRIRAAGYDAVHADVPAGSSAADYRAQLEEAGLVPAPGYFQAPFADPTATEATTEQAKLIAAQHAELGLDRIFLADGFGGSPERFSTPAQGVASDPARIIRIVDAIGTVAEAMMVEGVVPCLHQHVGTWIEAPAEVEQVLDAVPADILLLGPDTGHLAWAGADAVEFIGKHRDRVGAVHVKDIRLSVAREARAEQLDYMATAARHLWTEPGRGDLDLEGVLAVLGDFDGWYIVEVDIADQPTVDDTARVAAEWLRPRLEHRAAR